MALRSLSVEGFWNVQGHQQKDRDPRDARATVQVTMSLNSFYWREGFYPSKLDI